MENALLFSFQIIISAVHLMFIIYLLTLFLIYFSVRFLDIFWEFSMISLDVTFWVNLLLILVKKKKVKSKIE